MQKHTMFVGLDVHKDSISIALAEEGRDGEVRHYGKTGGDLASLDRAINKFQKNRQLHFVYEAGPTGYAAEKWHPLRGPRLPGPRLMSGGLQDSSCRCQHNKSPSRSMSARSRKLRLESSG